MLAVISSRGLISGPMCHVQGAPTAAAQGSCGGGAQQGGSIAASLSRGVFSRVGSLLGSGSGGGSKKVQFLPWWLYANIGQVALACNSAVAAASAAPSMRPLEPGGHWSSQSSSVQARCCCAWHRQRSWAADVLPRPKTHRWVLRRNTRVAESANPAQEARLGEENAFYYDEATGRWQEHGKAPVAEPPPPPPPPKAAPLPPPPAGGLSAQSNDMVMHAVTVRETMRSVMDPVTHQLCALAVVSCCVTVMVVLVTMDTGS